MDLTKRSFASKLFGRLFVSAIIIGPLLYAEHAARDAWHTRVALRTSKADEAGRTAARVLEGNVLPSPPTTPPGAPGEVAWMAHVGQWRGSRKNRHFDVLCTVARVDGLRIKDAKSAEIVTIEGFRPRVFDFAEGLNIDDSERVAVDFARYPGPTLAVSVTSATVPEPVRTLCKDILPSDSFDYEERFVGVGDVVTVRGCRGARAAEKGAAVIVPCGDGLDVLTASSLSAMRARTRDQHTPTLAYGAGAAVVGLGILGALASRRVARSKRREQGAKR